MTRCLPQSRSTSPLLLLLLLPRGGRGPPWLVLLNLQKLQRWSVLFSRSMPSLLNLVPRPSATISPDELPVCSGVAPGPRPSSALLPDDAPLMIHNRSVEEYQRLYHKVVDDMLRYLDGQLHPYSLALGRRIKQRLWERLERPAFTESVTEDGLVHVDVSYGFEHHPPLYDVDTSEEPKPWTPPHAKRAKH